MEQDRMTRKPARLSSYDYSQAGYYFITICSSEKRSIFGSVVGAGVPDGPNVALSEFGMVVQEQINEVNRISHDICIDKYIIMPNHVHLIVLISGSSRTPTPTNAGIPSFVSLFKRFTNRKCAAQLWQRGYYDHIIRDEEDYLRI